MSIRVVIADDAPFVREVLGHLLKKTEFEIVGEASNGEEAVLICAEKKPHLVIMDIVMPIKSGIQATQEIIAHNSDIKVIALSTEGSATIVTKAIEAGCCDYVVKPFEAKVLLAAMRSAVKIHGGVLHE